MTQEQIEKMIYLRISNLTKDLEQAKQGIAKIRLDNRLDELRYLLWSIQHPGDSIYTLTGLQNPF